MSLGTKTPAESNGDIAYVDNTNSGVDATLRSLKTGNGNTSSLTLSTNALTVKPQNTDGRAFDIQNKAGDTVFSVNSSTKRVKANGIDVARSNRTFGLYDLSPNAAGDHIPLATSSFLTCSGSTAFSPNEINGGVQPFGTGTNPATSLTITSEAKFILPCYWQLSNHGIEITNVSYKITSDSNITANIHVASYTIVAGSGSTSGNLTSGAFHALTGSATDSLSPVTSKDTQISNGSLTILEGTVAKDKVVICTVENVTDTSDITIELNIEYYATTT